MPEEQAVAVENEPVEEATALPGCTGYGEEPLDSQIARWATGRERFVIDEVKRGLTINWHAAKRAVEASDKFERVSKRYWRVRPV